MQLQETKIMAIKNDSNNPQNAGTVLASALKTPPDSRHKKVEAPPLTQQEIVVSRPPAAGEPTYTDTDTPVALVPTPVEKRDPDVERVVVTAKHTHGQPKPIKS
jgi:hypothetical protein